MTIAFVSSLIAGSTNGDGFTTGSVDTTGANFLCLFVYTTNTPMGTVSDSKSNTWVPLTEYPGFFGLRFGKLFYAENATVGSGHTFTISGTGTYPLIAMASFSGVASSSSFDVENGGGGFASSFQPGNVTPSQDGELLVTGFGWESNGVAPTIDSGFTITQALYDGSFGHQSGAIAYLIETTATSKNPTWTADNSAVAAIATFKAAAGGGGGGSPAVKIYKVLQAVKRASYY